MMTDTQSAPAIPTITVVKKHVQLDDGKIAEVFTCLDDRYRLWPDRTPGSTRWRWALHNWPDDGLGLKTHGAGVDLEDAVRQCVENNALREDVRRA